MPNQHFIAKELADILKIVAHPDRIRLIEELRGGEYDVTTLARALELTGSRVSQHLSLLRARRLVDERREGRRRVYRLSQPEMAGWILDGVDFLEAAVTALPPASIEDARRRWSAARADDDVVEPSRPKADALA